MPFAESSGIVAGLEEDPPSAVFDGRLKYLLRIYQTESFDAVFYRKNFFSRRSGSLAAQTQVVHMGKCRDGLARCVPPATTILPVAHAQDV